MRKITASIVAFIAVATMSQDRPPKAVVVPSTTSAVGPRWDKGAVEGGIYKNASVGLEITSAVGLEFGSPELKGNVGTVPLLVTITAVGAPKLFSGREVMAFYADALASYPENQRSTEAYLRKVVQGNQTEGFEPLSGTSESVLGGTTFARQDFQKESRYEAVLVKACKAQAIVFIFAGSDRDGVTKLIEGTRVKFDFERSGCGSNVSLQSSEQSNQSTPDGYVLGATFTSKFFGLTYNIPEGLIPQSTQSQEHPIDPSRPSATDFVLFLGAKPTKPYKNVVIHAQSAAGFNDGAAYLEKVASTAVRIGLTALNGPKGKTIAGETFFRQDNYSPKGAFYQTHVCTISKGYVLDFVLSANDRSDIEQLFNSLNSIQLGSTGQK